MSERVYIETTFVSYLTARASRDVVIAGHQQSTKEWWDDCRADYQFVLPNLFFEKRERVIRRRRKSVSTF